jgi:hypothetical protein
MAEAKAVCFFTAALFCLWNLGDLPDNQNVSLDRGMKTKFLLVIIEYRDLMCFPCQESLLDFCLSLPRPFQIERTWGVVVFDPAVEDEIKKKILAKKVQGFVSGNHILFPVAIDYLFLFNGLRTHTSQIILFDLDTQTISRYPFPLAREQRETILRAIWE